MKPLLAALVPGIVALILAVSPAAAQDEAEFAGNLRCYFTLMMIGVVQGFPGEAERGAAGSALSEAQARYRAAARALGLSGEALAARERAAQAAAGQEVEAMGGKSKAAAGVLAECLALAAPRLALTEAHRPYVELMAEPLWCHGVLTFLDGMGMIGGGEPRIERARKALGILRVRIDYFAGLYDVPAEAREALVEAFRQAALVEGHAFNYRDGDPAAFSRDYHTCFRWSEAAPVPNPFAPGADGPGIGDPWTIYNASSDLRAYYRCQATLIHLQTRRTEGYDPVRALEVLAYVGREIAGEVTARNIAIDVRAAMAADSAALAEALFEALDAGTYDGPEHHRPDYCFYLDWEERQDEIFEALGVGETAIRESEAAFEAGMWCLAALEILLEAGDPGTDRARIAAALDHHASIAIAEGQWLGLDLDATVGRLGEIKLEIGNSARLMAEGGGPRIQACIAAAD